MHLGSNQFSSKNRLSLSKSKRSEESPLTHFPFCPPSLWDSKTWHFLTEKSRLRAQIGPTTDDNHRERPRKTPANSEEITENSSKLIQFQKTEFGVVQINEPLFLIKPEASPIVQIFNPDFVLRMIGSDKTRASESANASLMHRTNGTKMSVRGFRPFI